MSDATSDNGRLSVFFARNNGGVVSDGRRRRCGGFGYTEWSFLIISIVNIALCVSLSLYRLVDVAVQDIHSPDFVFTILLIVNSAFCLFYVIHGLLRELQFEIYMFICAAIFVVGYCIVEYSFAPEPKRTHVKLARLILSCIFAPVNVILAFKVAREFGWLEFRILGASEHLQSMYHQATLFESLLKFDLQAAVSFTILVTVNDLVTSDSELHRSMLIILCVGVPFCVLLTFLGRLSMRQEWRCGVVLFAVLGLVMPGYVLYSIVTIYLSNGVDVDVTSKSSIIASEYVVGSLTLLVRGILFVELYIVYRNFGRGLRERAYDDEANERSGLLAR